MSGSTNYPTAEDDPLVVTSETKFDVAYMERTAAQIEALGREAVEQRSRAFTCCYPKADPDAAAIPAGRAVAMKAGLGPDDEPLMVLATAANLAAGGVLLGVLTEATAPGTRGRVANGGIIPPAISGLGTGSDPYVRANATTAALERVATLGGSDAKLGRATTGGTVMLDPAVSADGYTGFGISAGSIDNSHINAAAAIAGSKIFPNFGSQSVNTTGGISGNTISAITLMQCDELFVATAAETAALKVSSLSTGLVSSDGDGNLASTPLNNPGVVKTDGSNNFSATGLVNADVDAAAAIAGTKITPDFGSQMVTTQGIALLSGPASGLALQATSGAGSSKSMSFKVAGEVSTTDATPTDMKVVEIGTNLIVDVEAHVVAIKSDGTAHFRQRVQATLRFDGAGFGLHIAANTLDAAKTNGTTSGMLPEIVVGVGANKFAVRVTGRAAETWRWGARIEVHARTTTA